MFGDNMYLHRTMCDVLEEMRTMNKTRNFAGLHGLIEEAQTMGNRMETKISQIDDIENFDNNYNRRKRALSDHNKAIRKLNDEIEELEAKKAELTEEK
jgi:hypothetical protein